MLLKERATSFLRRNSHGPRRISSCGLAGITTANTTTRSSNPAHLKGMRRRSTNIVTDTAKRLSWMPSRTWDWANDAAHALALMPSSPRHFPLPGLPKSSQTTTSCVTRTVNRLHTSIMNVSREGDLRPSYSAKMRQDGLPRTLRSCRGFCARNEALLLLAQLRILPNDRKYQHKHTEADDSPD